METAKSARKTRCGTISEKGTARGNSKNTGKMIVKTGIVRNKFDE